MTDLYKEITGNSNNVTELTEFKNIAKKIRKAKNKSLHQITISELSKKVENELLRQGFNVEKDCLKEYGCGYKDPWNPCDCAVCLYDTTPTKIYTFYIYW